jgi:uncharacterized protein YecT (DUF1311 family)
MSRIFLLLIASAVAWGSEVISADTKDKQAALPCDTNQDTLNACAERRLQRAAAVLNKVFTSLLQVVQGSNSETLLQESQKLWSKFREADCRYAVSGLTPEGSMRDQVQNDCRALRTEERTVQLKGFAQCGSAGCPGQ